jgi:hypothetical protein
MFVEFYRGEVWRFVLERAGFRVIAEPFVLGVAR